MSNEVVENVTPRDIPESPVYEKPQIVEPDVSEEELGEMIEGIKSPETSPGHRVKEHVIEIDTSNSDVIFTTSYNRSEDSWNTRIKIGMKYLPKISHKTPLSEEQTGREGRDAKIIKQLKTHLSIDEGAADKMLSDVMLEAAQLEREFEKLASGLDAETPKIEAKYNHRIVEKARDILENDNPFIYYLNTWKKTYAVANDDDALGAMIICVVGSTQVVNSRGLHNKIAGPSGHGKSYAVKQAFNMFPAGKTFMGSLSAKAAFYKNLPAGTVVYCDDVDLGDDDFFTTIKQATNDYQHPTLRVSVSNGSSIDCQINERTGWILSAVDGFSDEQLDSRFGETEVVADEAHEMAIFTKQQDEEFIIEHNIEPDEDVLICRCMWDMIAEGGLVNIKIPFIKAIHWQDTAHPRSFPFFKDMIRCMTLFKIMQREKVGNCYIADIEDFYKAREIYKKMEKSNATKLNSNEYAILEYLSSQYSTHNLMNLGRVSRMALVSALGKSHNMKQQTIINTIHGKQTKNGNTGGLLAKVPGLQAECMANNAFGSGNKLWWYWYSGSVTKDGFTESIILDEYKAKEEIKIWRETAEVL